MEISFQLFNRHFNFKTNIYIIYGYFSVGYSFILPQKSNVSDSQTILLDIMGNMGTEVFKTFKRELSEDYPECLGNQPEELNLSDAAKKIVESFGGEGALRIAFHFLENGRTIL